MSKTAYILMEGHCDYGKMETNVIGIFEDKNRAYEAAVSRANDRYSDYRSYESPGEFIWTFNDSFPLEELYNHGVMYMSIGSEKTDTIVEYFTLAFKKGEIKE